MLCYACTNLFTGAEGPWYHVRDRGLSIPAYQHHGSPAQLAKAARDGCHICTIIWRKLSDNEKAVLLNTWSNAFLHRFSQGVQRLWSYPLAYYSWSPVWFSKEDFGVCFQFGDAPFWRKITFRIMPINDASCSDEEDEQDESINELVSPVSPDSPLRNRDLLHIVEAARAHTYSMWTRRIQTLVHGWYTTCTENHEACRAGYNSPHSPALPQHNFHPTRILYLGDDDTIKLDCSPADRKDQRYASLTHRWSINPATMPRLDIDKLPEWEKSINPAILTKTFQDAIKVARRMKLRYLWIDSLCILQTGLGWEEDWQKEAARMGEVYRHAFLNIQAGRDTDAGPYGIFKTPQLRDIEPFRVEINREVSRPNPISVNKKSPTLKVNATFWIVEEDFARDELIGNPINRRGWCLQERLLSHRIVHFGPQQVFWECRQLLACETFPEGLPKTIPQTLARAATMITRSPTVLFEPKPPTRSLTARILSPTKDLPLPSFPSLTCHRDLFGWFYLAELYSACSLTRETDKLVAISGLAQMFGLSSSYLTENQADVVEYLRTLALPRAGGAFADQYLDPHSSARPSGDYLAGLWKYDLTPCLLWHVQNGRQVSGAPSQRIPGTPSAPSWTWASINGLINASIYQSWGAKVDGHHLAELSYAHTTPVFADHPWGQVSNGEIRLVGRVIPEERIRWPTADELEGNMPRISAHTSEVHATMLRRFVRNSASVARQRVLQTKVVCYMDDMEEFTAKLRRSGPSFEIGLLPLLGLQRRRAAWDSKTGYTDEVYEYHGLVVVAKPMGDVILAERLGYFRVNDTKVFGAILSRETDKEVVLV